MSSIQSKVYEGAKTVTVSDTKADPLGPFAALYVTVTGNVKFTTINGDVVALTSVAANTEIPFVVSRVWSTGTSATVLGCTAPPYKGNPGGTT